MEDKCILVVSDNQEEVEVIRDILLNFNAKISLFHVTTGREALDVLMGGFGGVRRNVQEGRPAKPSALLIQKDLRDMPAFEVLSILKKYYTLAGIKAYLLAEELNDTERNVYASLVDGFVRSPVVNEKWAIDSLAQVTSDSRPDLTTLALSLGAMGGGSLSTKLTAMKSGFVLTKVAACIAGAVVLGAAIVDVTGNDQRVDLKTPAGIAGVIIHPVDAVDTLTIEVPMIIPADSQEVQVPVQPALAVQPAEEVDSVATETKLNIAEELPIADTVKPKKTFRIGVKEYPGTR